MTNIDLPLVNLKETVQTDRDEIDLKDAICTSDIDFTVSNGTEQNTNEIYYQVLCDWGDYLDLDNEEDNIDTTQIRMHGQNSWCHFNFTGLPLSNGLTKGIDYCSHKDLIPYTPDASSPFINPIVESLFNENERDAELSPGVEYSNWYHSCAFGLRSSDVFIC